MPFAYCGDSKSTLIHFVSSAADGLPLRRLTAGLFPVGAGAPQMPGRVEVKIPEGSGGKFSKVLAILVLLVLVAVSANRVVFRVDLGYVGVIVDPITGYISPTPVLGPRIGFKAPWRVVKNVYVATDAVHMWTEYQQALVGRGELIGDYPAIETLTKDGLQAWIDLTVRWHIRPEYAPAIVKSYPNLDYEDKFLIPEIRKVARDVVAQYEAAMISEVRQSIGLEIMDRLQRNLDADEKVGGAFVIDEVYVRNIRLPDEFMNAIQAKLAAQQRMIAAEYERNRTLILANASAQAKILEAQGEAEARIIQAKAVADAIDLIAQAGGNRETIAQLYVLLQNLAQLQANGTRFIIVLSPEGAQLPILYPVGG